MTKLELTYKVLELLKGDNEETMISKVWNNVMFCGEQKATNFVKDLLNENFIKASTKFNKEELLELVELLKTDSEQANKELFYNLKSGFDLITEDNRLDLQPSVKIIRNFVDSLPKHLVEIVFTNKEITSNMVESLNKYKINNNTFYKLLVLNLGFKLETFN